MFFWAILVAITCDVNEILVENMVSYSHVMSHIRYYTLIHHLHLSIRRDGAKNQNIAAKLSIVVP